jgi:hypothetical protein
MCFDADRRHWFDGLLDRSTSSCITTERAECFVSLQVKKHPPRANTPEARWARFAYNSRQAIHLPMRPPPAHPLSLLAPVAIWTTLQFLAILLAGLRIPLSAGYPRPAEGVAVHVLVFVQMVSLSALFPLLLRSWPAAVLVTVLSWPYLLLASFLATASMEATLRVGAIVTAWAICLAAWGWALRSDAQRAVAVAGSLLLTLGGAVVAYLAAEYRPDPLAGSGLRWWQVTPMIAALQQASGGPFRVAPYVLIAVLSAMAAGIGLVRRRRGDSHRVGAGN